MNNLIYGTQEPAKVAAKIEELLARELGATPPLAYEVQDSGVGKISMGAALKESLGFVFGASGEEVPLFVLSFALTTPRVVNVDVTINRQARACHVGRLLYTTPLSKKVASEVSLDEPKTFGKSQFVGDAAATTKLNANKDIVKKANEFSRTKTALGAMELKIPRFFKIVPDESGAVLVGATLGYLSMMGIKGNLDAQSFVELADLIDSAL